MAKVVAKPVAKEDFFPKAIFTVVTKRWKLPKVVLFGANVINNSDYAKSDFYLRISIYNISRLLHGLYFSMTIFIHLQKIELRYYGFF